MGLFGHKKKPHPINELVDAFVRALIDDVRESEPDIQDVVSRLTTASGKAKKYHRSLLKTYLLWLFATEMRALPNLFEASKAQAIKTACTLVLAEKMGSNFTPITDYVYRYDKTADDLLEAGWNPTEAFAAILYDDWGYVEGGSATKSDPINLAYIGALLSSTGRWKKLNQTFSI
jgi:hypothetical protein